MSTKFFRSRITLSMIIIPFFLVGCGAVPTQGPKTSRVPPSSVIDDQQREQPQVLSRSTDVATDLADLETSDDENIAEPEHRVLFDFNSALITDEAAKILEHNARWLASKKGKIQIEGNCDERGTREYNLALGQKRADAVKRFFLIQGIDPDRIQTISYGKERPLFSGHNESAWSRNRRANIVFQTSE